VILKMYIPFARTEAQMRLAEDTLAWNSESNKGVDVLRWQEKLLHKYPIFSIPLALLTGRFSFINASRFMLRDPKTERPKAMLRVVLSAVARIVLGYYLWKIHREPSQI